MNQPDLCFRLFGFSVEIRWQRWPVSKIAKYSLAAPKSVPALERSLLRQIKAALCSGQMQKAQEWPSSTIWPGRSTWPPGCLTSDAQSGRIVLKPPAWSNN